MRKCKSGERLINGECIKVCTFKNPPTTENPTHPMTPRLDKHLRIDGVSINAQWLTKEEQATLRHLIRKGAVVKVHPPDLPVGRGWDVWVWKSGSQIMSSGIRPDYPAGSIIYSNPPTENPSPPRTKYTIQVFHGEDLVEEHKGLTWNQVDKKYDQAMAMGGEPKIVRE